MSENTNIEWCDATFNPWEGCTKVSPGCDHCYAETRNARFGGGNAPNWGPGAPRRRTSESNWRKPLTWNKQAYWQCTCGWRGIERDMLSCDDGFGAWTACPHCHQGQFSPTRARVFCASLADVFDNQVPTQWRIDLFNLIAATPDLDWLLLTKRIGNAKAMMDQVARHQPIPGKLTDPDPLSWQPMDNVWLGATITSQAEADRDIPKLLDVPARVRFLSMEPLLGPVDLTRLSPSIYAASANALTGKWKWQDGPKKQETPPLDWVIVGGESGPGARPMHPDWARSLRDQCAAAGVPFLFKQWGEWGPFINEDHYTHGGAEKQAHAWVDAETAEHGKCWLIDDDGAWSNWTGDPRMLPDGQENDRGGNLHGAVSVMGHHGKKAAGRLLDGVEHNGFPGGAA